MLEKTHCGLVVIDSIAAVFRGDYTPAQSVTRAKDLREIGLQLHKISRYFGLAILCVNQVVLNHVNFIGRTSNYSNLYND